MLSEFLSKIKFEVNIITNTDLTPILEEIYIEMYGINDSVKFKQVNEIETFEQSILISIEYPGANECGICHSMNGRKISDIDSLIEQKIKQNPPIHWIAIGDGGNELGMGRFRDVTNRILTKDGKCYCGCGGGIGADLHATDAILGVTSNYATISLIFEISTLLGMHWEYKWNIYANILKKLNENGIYDGVNKELNSVDGISEQRLTKLYFSLSNFYSQKD